MNYSGVYFLFLIIILVSCNSSLKEEAKANRPKNISILDTKTDRENLPLLKDVNAFKLESNPSVLMANCNKIEEHNNELFILDRRFSNLFVFDLSGKYLRKIGSLGSGPGQFQSIYGFAIDRKTDEVLVYSLNDQAIFRYKLDGTFLNKTGIDFYGYDFELTQENEYIFNTRYNDTKAYSLHNVIVTEKNGKVKSSLFPYPKEATTMVMNLSGFLCLDDNTGYYNHAFSDTVYSVNVETKEVTPSFIFDLGNKQWPYGFDFQKLMSKSNEAISSNYLAGAAFASNSFIFFGFMEAQTKGLMPKSGIFDMKTNTVYTTNNRPNEFILKYLNGIPIGKTQSGQFISSITAGQVELIKNNFPEAWDHAKEWYPSITNLLEDFDEEESNPIVITYSLNR